MITQILDGKKLASSLSDEIKSKLDKRKAKGLSTAHLAIILVGNNPSSLAYVNNKIKNCKAVGMKASLFDFKENVSQEELLLCIKKINLDPSIDGFIVQLPLPSHINKEKIILAIDPSKDVDGFHPLNLGKMILREKSFLPATAYGILQLFENYKIELKSKNVVLVGRSLIVGRPLSVLLSMNSPMGNATVTLTHSDTKDLIKFTKEADVLIVAVGKPHFMKAHMIKKGAVVVDVGINKLADLNDPKGYKLVGDVDFKEVLGHVSSITPVPGGIGPMTCIMLLQNTLQALEQKEKKLKYF